MYVNAKMILLKLPGIRGEGDKGELLKRGIHV
jgi:hypothetical protein